ncbi:MAG: hypothetical protein V7693_16200 [Halopseudomonas sabulinigri]
MAAFNERVYIRFQPGKAGTHNDALIAELVESLDLKKSMGVHQSFIKQAIFEKFMREREAGFNEAIPAPQQRQAAVTHEQAVSVSSATPNKSQSTDNELEPIVASVSVAGEVESRMLAPSRKPTTGMKNLMG